MKNIIEILLTDPLFIKIGIILGILISLSIFKKLKKVIIVLVIVLFTYSYYTYSIGQKNIELVKVKKKMKRLMDHNQKTLEKTVEKSIEHVKEKIDNNLK